MLYSATTQREGRESGTSDYLSRGGITWFSEGAVFSHPDPAVQRQPILDVESLTSLSTPPLPNPPSSILDDWSLFAGTTYSELHHEVSNF